MPASKKGSKSARAVHFEGRQAERRMRVRHTTSGISSPLEISGSIGWYDFSDITSLWQDTARTNAITADGQIILGVTDKSGNGKHLSQATNGPTYKVDIIQGRSIARFDGTNDQLSNAAWSADASQTFFFVAQKTGAPSAASDTLFSGSNDTAQLFVDTDNHATAYNYYATQAGGVQANVGGTATNVTLMILRLNSASSLDIYANGGTATNFDPNDQLSTTTTIQICVSGLGTNFGDYDVAEIIAYNSALAAADINRVGPYLSARWGFTWTAVT